jgi:hypothetical protein
MPSRLAPTLLLSGFLFLGLAVGFTLGFSPAPKADILLNLSNPTPLSHPQLANFTGVISGPAPAVTSRAPDLTERFHQLGITAVRNNDYYDDRLDIEGIFNCGGTHYPSWTGCSAEEETWYRWESSDALMDTLVKGGFEPFLRLGGEWENKLNNHQSKGPQSAVEEQNWIIAAKKVAHRYEPHYSYLNIWTEFPGEHFWDRSNEEFLNFWVDAYKAIKPEFPNKKVGGPGFGPGVGNQVSQGKIPNDAYTLLSKLYSQKLPLDWLGWHLFSNESDKYISIAKGYQDLLWGKGAYSRAPWAGSGFFDKTELILDAYGLRDRAPPKSDVPMTETELRQIMNGGRGAAILGSTWISLQQTTVLRAFIYRAGDVRSEPDGSPPGRSGLFYGDPAGTPKPSAYAVRAWNYLRSEYPTVVAIAQNTLSAILCQNSKGDYAVLVVNNTPTLSTWDLQLPNNQKLTGFKQKALATIDDQQDGSIFELIDTLPTIPAYSVQLLKLSKGAP